MWSDKGRALRDGRTWLIFLAKSSVKKVAIRVHCHPLSLLIFGTCNTVLCDGYSQKKKRMTTGFPM
jgi:hypothetical protein